jgi:organic radical activating enzyme
MKPKWIELSTLRCCPVGCAYCPQTLLKARSKETEVSGVLAPDILKAALETVPKDVQIHFSGFTEPFMNPYCADMIKLVSDMDFKIDVYTTLSGCSVGDLKKVKDVPLVGKGAPVIHLPDNKGLLTVDINDKYLESLKYVEQRHTRFTKNASYVLVGKGVKLHDKIADIPLTRIKRSRVISRASNLKSFNVNKQGPICSAAW